MHHNIKMDNQFTEILKIMLINGHKTKMNTMMKERRKSNLFRIILLYLMIEIFKMCRLNLYVKCLYNIISAHKLQSFVIKCSMKEVIYGFTKEFTLRKSHIHANFVLRCLLQLETEMTTREYI